MTDTSPRRLSDADLLAALTRLARAGHRWTANLLEHIAEVDARRLYRNEACSSMFVYCTQRLHMSEGETYNRITAARAARRFPVIYEMVSSGALHVTGIRMLAPLLTGANHRELLQAARHKSKRELQQLIATCDPRPDVPAGIRQLPVRWGAAPWRSSDGSRVTGNRPFGFLGPAAPAPAPPARCLVEALSEKRFKVQFTASAALRDKILETQKLLRAAVPNGDLPELFDRAVSLLLTKLKRTKLGTKTRPTKAASTDSDRAKSTAAPTPRRQPAPPSRTPDSRHVPNAVKRAVCDRDEDRCTFTADDGRRCTATAFLEFHHIDPFAHGGPATIDNITLHCSAHNALQAERDFGDRPSPRRKVAARCSSSACAPASTDAHLTAALKVAADD